MVGRRRGRRGPARHLAAAGAGLAWLAPAVTNAAPIAPGPPCRVEVVLDPPRAVRGAQVIYELRVHRREDVREVVFERPLAFPALRTEWLPGRARSLRTEAGGARYDLVVERRALFAFRAGRLPLAGPILLCQTGPAGTGAGETFRVVVPERVLEVVEPPARGRPPAFSGLVGPLRLQTVLEPRTLRVGESARLAVIAVGSGNLFEAPGLIPAALEGRADLEVLRRPRQLATDPGERLRVRVTDAVDLVPQRPGRFAVPEVVLPFYDPRAARYRVARSAPRVLVATPPAPEPAEPPAPPAPPARPGRGLGGWAWLLGGLLAGGLWLWHRSRSRDPEVDGLLERAEQALRAGHGPEAAGHLAAALRRALEPRLPGARALTPPEIRLRAAGDTVLREVADLLEILEAARFARAGPEDGEGLRARVRAAVSRLGRRRRA